MYCFTQIQINYTLTLNNNTAINIGLIHFTTLRYSKRRFMLDKSVKSIIKSHYQNKQFI